MSLTPHNSLPDSFVRTIATSDLADVAADIGEVALDSLLAEGALRDLPVVGSIVGIWKTGASVRDVLLLRKLIAFLNGLSSIPQEKRQEMIRTLQEPHTSEGIGEKLLSLIDHFESTSKARLLARAFGLYTAESITKDEFWRLSFILDRLPLADITAIKSWRDLDLNRVEHVRKHLYLSVGLGWFVMDASSNGFQWQARLCSILSDALLM